MNLNQILEKHGKKIILILFLLFMFKTFQSCNRHSSNIELSNKMTDLADSLQLKIDASHDSIVKLQYELKLAEFSAVSAEKRAEAIQSTAEKTTRNTTIQIK
jgi:hypothetical protein